MKKIIKAFCMSFSMFCSIPTPFSHVWEDDVRSLMLVIFPFVGTIIGSLWALAGLILIKINFPHMFFACIMTLMPYWLTGGIHLDGFMDCCDAIFSRRTVEKKREILKDSHVGSFAVIHLAMLFLIGFSGFASTDGTENLWVLVFICTAVRSFSALGVSIMKPMGHSEYAGNFQQDISKLNVRVLITILIISNVIAYFLFGIKGLIAVFVSCVGYAFTAYYAYRDLEGFSGDVTGFGHTIGELCGVLALTLL